MIFADLHIHIGQSLDGKAVKITASNTLTLPNVINVSRDIKGLSLIGVVDSHSIGVQKDFETLLAAGALHPLANGGYDGRGITIIPGHEIELKIGKGNAHFLAFFATIEQMKRYLKVLKPTTKNWQLSTQKGYIPVEQWLEAVRMGEGLWFPAHAFTPHKGIYGNCCERLNDTLPSLPNALEIGLSADRAMAESLSELDSVVLFSNSDAHSLPNIAREYNTFEKADNSFGGLLNLIEGKQKMLVRNFGLPPKVGKYHRTYCLSCEKVVTSPAPQLICPTCGSQHVVTGVLDRLASIADRSIGEHRESTYVYQIPLRQLPGVGAKTYERLLKAFGTEMAVLHEAAAEDLERTVGEKVTDWIIRARHRQIQVAEGGGGVFGRVVDILSHSVE